MGNVVYLDAWRSSEGSSDEAGLDIDLMTAVDVALRDLADITQHINLDAAREQAEICRRMLKAAFEAALCEG
jgi:hypothetical protein